MKKNYRKPDVMPVMKNPPDFKLKNAGGFYLLIKMLCKFINPDKQKLINRILLLFDFSDLFFKPL